jgi:diguanylate cyclase (GGDEF)-like protein
MGSPNVAPPAPGVGRFLDLTDIRHAAEVDFASAQRARREAIDMMRRAADLAEAASRREREARESLLEAARLRDEATVDELTGALRRNGGFVALAKEVERSRREGHSLVVGFVDVDGLKEVNDTRGHLSGDELLKAVVCALRASMRSYDVLVRYGGDEFVCSFGGATVAAAEQRFEQVRALLRQAAPGRSVSAGFAEVRPGDDLETVICRADLDLYRRRARPVRER